MEKQQQKHVIKAENTHKNNNMKNITDGKARTQKTSRKRNKHRNKNTKQTEHKIPTLTNT